MDAEIRKLAEEAAKTDINVLLTAKEEAKNRTLSDPSDSNLRALERATRMLEGWQEKNQDLSTGHQSAAPSWQQFNQTSIRKDVYRFLLSMGFRVSERTFYRHCKDGKLKKGKGNKYTRRLVSVYAANHLHRDDTTETDNEKESNLLAVKLLEEVKKVTVTRKREEIKLRREQGTIVDRDALNLELAARAIVLDAGFKQLINTKAMEWIVAVNGDTEKLPEFLEQLGNDWDTMIDAYNTTDEFEVLFDGGEDIKNG